MTAGSNRYHTLVGPQSTWLDSSDGSPAVASRATVTARRSEPVAGVRANVIHYYQPDRRGNINILLRVRPDGMAMQVYGESRVGCDNCESTEPVAYTLTTYVDGGDGDVVDLHFCSAECLRVWT